MSLFGLFLFGFVWLPCDELTTARRLAIGNMLSEAAGGALLNWAVAMDDVVALIRYTIDLRGRDSMPDVAALDQRLARMMRGWAPGVEAALTELDPTRATRLTLRWANCFPQSYRTLSTPDEASRDILALSTLDGPGDRAARLYRDDKGRARLNLYRMGGAIALSDAVPVLENIGFRVIEEVPTALSDDQQGFIHEFLIEAAVGAANVFDGDTKTLETAIAQVLEGNAENDAFNRLIVDLNMAPTSAVLFRAWFRYLRQGGLTYGLTTVVDALRRAPHVTQALGDRFCAAHAPHGTRGDGVALADKAIAKGLDQDSAIDDDRILRAIKSVIAATLRTNAFTPAADEALAFKLDSHKIPGLPAPLPWREIWVYSPRVEGIHLRAGPIARGGLRWSDRRDDFRTEILGLMKAQRVKNAVIVPTGAKGGFYPKQLPSPAIDRDAWFAEGTESYRIFIRTLLSVTDNIVEGRVVHPEGVAIHDAEDPYFVVDADKGTATFSEVANAIAVERGFWLGAAFASGGSHGYDRKAMGVDVQTQPIRVAGVGDMSGDVFGNVMLLSKALKLVAAFDHRHIFIDPDPAPAKSWAERERMFTLPRSSWADYNA